MIEQKRLLDELRIVPMGEENINEVYRIEVTLFPVPWSKFLFKSEVRNPRAIYLVARIDTEIIGYVGMSTFLEEGHITTVAVKKEYQNLGIGKRLIEYVLQRAEMRSIRKFSLEVRVSNKIAQRLYFKFGFYPVGVRKRYYSDGEGALIMWK